MRQCNTKTKDLVFFLVRGVMQLRAGQSIRNIAKITGKGVSTVQRVKAAMDSRE
jgi:transposase